MTTPYVDQLKAEADEKISNGDYATFETSIEVTLNPTLGMAHIFTPSRRRDLIARYLSEGGWKKAYVVSIGNQGRLFLQAS